MKVIPEPADGERPTVIRTGDDFPDGPVLNITGKNRLSVDYVCGSCGRVLIANAAPGQVQDIVFQCPGCRAYNDTDFAPQLN